MSGGGRKGFAKAGPGGVALWPGFGALSSKSLPAQKAGEEKHVARQIRMNLSAPGFSNFGW
ncbi:MAG: hypothetical protein HFE84_00160 [Lachnospiraceae bacterium]|nr:hypothetical protein [Lachnospiraceae bacterium]